MLEQNLRECISIEHVGSTSIPGMKAKPIIDIDVVVQDEAQFLSVKEDLEKIGYIHKGDLGISGREVFDEDNVSIKIAHHLYVCKKDNPELLRHIAFIILTNLLSSYFYYLLVECNRQFSCIFPK